VWPQLCYNVPPINFVLHSYFRGSWQVAGFLNLKRRKVTNPETSVLSNITRAEEVVAKIKFEV
jgi:hypothetical protein